MSGNSSRSVASTSPIERCSERRRRRRSSAQPPDPEDEDEPADLDLVAVGAAARGRPGRGSRRCRSASRRPGPRKPSPARSITAWRRDTVMSSRKMSESGWRPTRSRSRVEQVGAARVRAPGDDQHALPSGSSAMAASSSSSSRSLDELGEAQGRFVLVRQRAAAGGAEARPGLVPVAAPAAVMTAGYNLTRRSRPSPSTCRRGNLGSTGATRGSTLEVEGEVEGCRRSPRPAPSATVRGSVGAPSSRSVTVARVAGRRVDRRRPAAGADEQVDLVERQPVEQDRAVLEDRAARAGPGPSRTACGPPPAGRRPGPREARRPGRAVVPGRSAAVDPEPGQPGDQRAGEHAVDRVDVARRARRAAAARPRR